MPSKLSTFYDIDLATKVLRTGPWRNIVGRIAGIEDGLRLSAATSRRCNHFHYGIGQLLAQLRLALRAHDEPSVPVLGHIHSAAQEPIS
jgi:hypothetical protein